MQFSGRTSLKDQQFHIVKLKHSGQWWTVSQKWTVYRERDGSIVVDCLSEMDSFIGRETEI